MADSSPESVGGGACHVDRKAYHSTEKRVGACLSWRRIVEHHDPGRKPADPHRMVDETGDINWAVKRIQTFSSEIASEACTVKEQLLSDFRPSHWEVRFISFTASYEDWSSSAHLALKDINLNKQPGEHIGICGRSGSGKSTLLSALFRLVAVQNGMVTIGRTDISTIPTDSLRRGLNGIPQSSFFLQGSFRLNLDLESSTLDDASLWSALHKVQLANLVSSWGGLDVELKSTILSYGQRQLLSLARALLSPRKVIVLDEVTSAVNEDTDRLMRSIVRTDLQVAQSSQ